ncbi:MAG: TonB-dependent receptor, partial [Sediminibacterium sp.]
MLYGQKAGFKGSITDTTGKQPLHYAVIALISKADSTLINSIRSNTEGKFQLDKLKPGAYTVMLTYPEMADFLVDINLADTGILDIGKIVMTSRYHLLEEVTVRAGKAIRMRGDTLEYKADSFQVAPGANVEALLRRLPGIEIGPDGKIKAQGKIVNTVLVDGDEFFRDDPTLVTQYLKASSVDKVQVFDKKSVQAEFTGIDDGMSNKTMNITLKEDSKKGLFGKLSAGTNADGFYSHDGMLNKFNGKEKMAVYGISSNTGRTGLGYEDRSKFLTSTQSGIRIEDESGLMEASDFDDVYGSGLPSSTNIGSQYVNKWKQNKQSVNISYAYNRLQTKGWETHSGTQLLPDNSIRSNKGNNNVVSLNNKHNAVAVYESQLDSFSTVRLMLNGQSGETSNAWNEYAESKDGLDNFLNKSSQSVTTRGNQRSVAGNFILQKRFRKQGRLASLFFEQNNQERVANKLAETTNFFFSSNNPTADTLNQFQNNVTKTNSTRARITFTEPISKFLLISSEYTLNTISNNRNRDVFGRSLTGKYDDPIDTLSNNYHFKIRSHIPGITVQYRNEKLTLTGGSKLSFSELEQVNLNLHETIKRNFNNFFPTARIAYSLTKQNRIEFEYNGNTRQPSIEQLQPLRDNSNPLYINIGNPNLRPSFAHSLRFSYTY